MANWCANQLSFTGSEVSVKQVLDLFLAMKLKEEQTNEGQVPELISVVQDGYFFNLYLDEPPEQIYYETKWSPNILDVLTIGEHYKVDFELSYQECGNCIFGKTIYQNGELKEYDLTFEDIAQVEYDPDNDVYKLRGEILECEDAGLEIIFQEKFNLTY